MNRRALLKRAAALVVTPRPAPEVVTPLHATRLAIYNNAMRRRGGP